MSASGPGETHMRFWQGTGEALPHSSPLPCGTSDTTTEAPRVPRSGARGGYRQLRERMGQFCPCSDGGRGKQLFPSRPVLCLPYPLTAASGEESERPAWGSRGCGGRRSRDEGQSPQTLPGSCTEETFSHRSRAWWEC